MAGNEQLAGASAQGIVDKALEVAETMAGKRYVYGGKTTDGFDCSGYVSYVLKAVFPASAASLSLDVAGFAASGLFEDVTTPQRGDIVIFPAENGYAGHIGIVVSDTAWIGSQSSTGVRQVLFSNSWWGRRTKTYRRIKLVSQTSVSLGLSSFARRVA